MTSIEICWFASCFEKRKSSKRNADMALMTQIYLFLSRLFSRSSWQKWPTVIRIWSLLPFMVIGAGVLSACKHSAQPVAEAHMQPQAPIKLPIPLDKAGYKVDTTFWFIHPEPPRAYFVGLNIPFTAGDGTRIELIDAHPVKAKVTLHRIEKGGAETKMTLKMPVDMAKPEEPSKYEWVPLPSDEAYSERSRSYGTDDKTKIDGATYELSFGSAGMLEQGQYRLQVELLEDNPALKDLPAYLVVDLVGHSK